MAAHLQALLVQWPTQDRLTNAIVDVMRQH
jgi:hypothetical protein